MAALLHDRDRYVGEEPAIAAPDAIVISGDIIQGVKLGEPDAESIIAAQYREAEDLVRRLAEAFVDGQIDKIVIVPGNHDVDWNCCLGSMAVVDHVNIAGEVSEKLRKINSGYRWDWRTLTLYQIVNRSQYDKRLDAYWDFIDRIYKKSTIVRPPTRQNGYGLFELANGAVCIAAFNSCAHNDCFSHAGSIEGQIIAEAVLEMRSKGLGASLRIGVWHHNTEGSPNTSDYMDVETMRFMMVGGVRLGFHGHQHHTQVTPQLVRLPDSQTMAVVSAGSICAGPLDLPTGSNHQYNVIVINDDFLSARVHVRGRTVGNMFGSLQLQQLGGKSFSDIEWTAVPAEYGGAISSTARMDARLLEAEKLQHAGDQRGVIALLAPIHAQLDLFGRAVLIKAAHEKYDWSRVREFASSPRNAQEVTWLVAALIELGAFAEAKEQAEAAQAAGLIPRPIAKDLINRVQIRKVVSGNV